MNTMFGFSPAAEAVGAAQPDASTPTMSARTTTPVRAPPLVGASRALARRSGATPPSDRDVTPPDRIVGMLLHDLFVEIDAEPGPGRHRHVALLPVERLLENLVVEAAPLADALLDEEVRRAGVELQA